MGLVRATVLASLDASLLDAASVFGEPNTEERTAALSRHLDEAVRDFDRVLPLVVDDALTLMSDVRNYVADPRARSFVDTPLIYENSARDLTDPYRVEVVPTPTLRVLSGMKTWAFTPTPTASILFRLGSDYRFSFKKAHLLSDTEADSTVFEEDLPLLITRAQIAALKEISIRNLHKPVVLRDTMFSQTRNGTPAGLADVLMGQWEQQAREASQRYGLGVGGGA